MEEESAEESWGFSRQLLALVATVLVFFFFFLGAWMLGSSGMGGWKKKRDGERVVRVFFGGGVGGCP